MVVSKKAKIDKPKVKATETGAMKELPLKPMNLPRQLVVK
jgi:hypothetical protein